MLPSCRWQCSALPHEITTSFLLVILSLSPPSVSELSLVVYLFYLTSPSDCSAASTYGKKKKFSGKLVTLRATPFSDSQVADHAGHFSSWKNPQQAQTVDSWSENDKVMVLNWLVGILSKNKTEGLCPSSGHLVIWLCQQSRTKGVNVSVGPAWPATWGSLSIQYIGRLGRQQLSCKHPVPFLI